MVKRKKAACEFDQSISSISFLLYSDHQQSPLLFSCTEIICNHINSADGHTQSPMSKNWTLISKRKRQLFYKRHASVLQKSTFTSSKKRQEGSPMSAFFLPLSTWTLLAQPSHGSGLRFSSVWAWSWSRCFPFLHFTCGLKWGGWGGIWLHLRAPFPFFFLVGV